MVGEHVGCVWWLWGGCGLHVLDMMVMGWLWVACSGHNQDDGG